MEERCFHRQSPPVIDVWCVHSKVCSEKCYFDSGSADYLSCHFVLPGLKASVDRLNVFICVNTFFLLMNPLWIEGGVRGYLICDTRVRRKWGGINYGVLRWKRVWFSFMPFQMSRWPRELTVFPLCFLFSASLNSSGGFSVIHHSRYVCPLPRRLFTQTPFWKSLFIRTFVDCNDFPPGEITVMVMMIIWEMLRI